MDRYDKPKESFDFIPAGGNICRGQTHINRPLKGREGRDKVKIGRLVIIESGLGPRRTRRGYV